MDMLPYVLVSKIAWNVALVFMWITAPLVVFRAGWWLVKTIAFDVIAIYSGYRNSQLDLDNRRVKLKAAEQILAEQRRLLASGAPLAQMWKAGAFDVLIDDKE